jgi:S1-C subfamily serine protease
MRTKCDVRDDERMANASSLTALSTQIGDLVEAAAPSVVQVFGHRRPGSGLVYASDIVLTTARSLGGEDGLHVRGHDGAAHDAQLAGWDPATNLAVVRVPGFGGKAIAPSASTPRVGEFGIALARSWSNAVTATSGIISVIGGPLATGRRRGIEQVLRTSAPMHDGFSGGAFLDPSGGLIGVATAAKIRGLGVIIPAAIAWKTAATLLEHGTVKRGYLGIAAQPVRLPEDQRPAPDRSKAVLAIGITSGSPAASAGVLVGDVILDVDGRPVESPEDLLDLLGGRAGQTVTLRIARGGTRQDVAVVVGERPDTGA